MMLDCLFVVVGGVVVVEVEEESAESVSNIPLVTAATRPKRQN